MFEIIISALLPTPQKFWQKIKIYNVIYFGQRRKYSKRFILYFCPQKIFYGSKLYTSVCLIYFPESTADSKKSLGDINIPNTVSKSFNCPPIILNFFRSEISIVIEISVDFNLLGIVEFQIYLFILPILQANLGKKWRKSFQDV